MPSDDIAISVRNLTKTYRLFGHPGDRIKQFLSFGFKRYHREFTALKDVSFDIRKGETVGIIGRNGSGKSTLLQVICGILKPTSGTVEVNGRVSALLELGAGFNPEFTGRENIYFQGALQGFRRAAMNSRFDAIAAFADIGEFIDQPVRTYSSGMFVRLAFAVAINVDPEVLAVDEALAVGDAGFRARCYRRIGDLRAAGCTILFVSHDMEQVINLCGRVILLDEAEQLMNGSPASCVAQLQRLSTLSPEERAALRDKIRTRQDRAPEVTRPVEPFHDAPEEIGTNLAIPYEPNGALIEEVRLSDDSGQSVRLLKSGRAYRCLFRARFVRDATFVRGALLIKTQDGFRVGGTMTAPSADTSIKAVAAGETAIAEFEFYCCLNPGTYLLDVAVFGSTAGVEYALHGLQGAIAFRVRTEQNGLSIGTVDFGMQTSFNLMN